MNRVKRISTASLPLNAGDPRFRAASTLLLIAVISWAAAYPASAGIIATSSTEFAGVQGQNGWTYGYRDVPAEGASENYDPDRDFIAFAGGDGKGEWNGTTQQWTGTAWKAADGSEITGPGSGLAASTRWTIRRWEAAELAEKSPVSLKWTLSKSDVTCGNGVTGALSINGQLVDKTTIAFDRATTLTRTFYALLCPNDRVDLVLRPLGADGASDAQCDSALMSLVVNTTITAADPKQPNGKSFLSTLTTPKFEMVPSSSAGGQVTLNWHSQSAAVYGIEASGDLVSWTRIKTGVFGSPCQSSLSETLANPPQGPRFYRVVEEFKSLAGLWVGYYDNCCYGLVRVTLNNNQAKATWLIKPEAAVNVSVDWQADVTTGVGTGATDHGTVSSQLKIINPDRLTVKKSGLSSLNTYRRVD